MDINWKNNKLIANWKNNKLRKKIFKLGLATYVLFSILIYFVIYYGIPIMYTNYKTSDFNRKVQYVLNNSKTIDDLQNNVINLSENSNIVIFFEYQGIRYEYDYRTDWNIGKFKPRTKDDDSLEREDILHYTDVITIDGSDTTIFFSAAVSSTKEVQNILFMFLPIFGILSMGMALLSSYAISNRLSKNIMKLRNDARKVTSLDFDIVQTVTTDDELGDLSNSLVVMASTLCETLNELQDANAKLYDDIEKERIKEEERRAYIATISHDLKTPLTAIKGQLEGMLYDIGKYKDHKTFLKKNIELADEMESMIQSIILSSKLDDYNASINKQDCNLASIIEDIIDDLDYSIEEKKLIINNDIKNDIEVNVDANLFKRALANLIGNAIQYANRDSIINITINDDILMISNEIDDFDQNLIDDDLIFKPFYRQDKSRNKNGSGLGMYIVKKICDLHKIDIKLSYENNLYTVELNLNN